MKLPLYEGSKPPLLAVERAEPAALDSGCTRCRLGQGSPGARVRSPCMSGDGEPGGLLLVGEAPGRDEDAVGRPFVGASGKLLRRLVAEHSPFAHVAYDNALRCAPGRANVTPTMIRHCRPYLAATVAEGFERIVCLGATAARAITGRGVPPFSVRGACTFLSDGTPVFFVIHPAAALRNRFVMGWFVEDFERALTAEPPRVPWGGEVEVVESVADAERAMHEVRARPWASFDVETAGRMWCADFEVVSVAVCGSGTSKAWVWPRSALRDARVFAPLLHWFADARAKKVGQNVKYDQLAVRDGFGVIVRGVVGDTRLQRKLLDPDASSKLEVMAELVGMGGLKEEARAEMLQIVRGIQRRAKVEPTVSAWPGIEPAAVALIRSGQRSPKAYAHKLLGSAVLARYNARDAVATTALAERLSAELAAEKPLARIWSEIVLPAALALEHVEAWGIAVDRERLRAFGAHLDQGIARAKAQLDDFPGVNWNSAPQVRALLFERFGLPVLKSTPTGLASIDAAVLARLAEQHPFPRVLLEYRTLTKLKGTYVDGLREHVRDDGRVHPNIKLDGARSGRTSCTDPNCQNVPRAKDSPEGKMARDCFVAPPGRTFVDLDYGQLELRVAAALSGDPLMRAIFEEGVDYHQRTAELISRQAWGIEPERVESKHRTAAKTINFALLYGMSDGALAATLGSSKAQAARIRAAILGQFRRLNAWCRECLAEARRTGVTWTWWDGERGRRRSLHPIADADGESRSRAEHGAWNTRVQGTASEFLVRSLAACVDWIVGDGLGDDVKLILPVHDELLFEVRDDLVPEVVEAVTEIMTGWNCAGVPLVVDAKVGRSWGSLVSYEATNVRVHAQVR